MSQENTIRTDLITQYLKSRLSEEDFLATLTQDEQEAYKKATILVRGAVIAELASQVSAKPNRATNVQGRMGRVGITQSSDRLD